MTPISITNVDTTDQLRPLSQDEVDTVAGGLKALSASQGGLQCAPIFEDDGHGGIIVISPTLGPLARWRL